MGTVPLELIELATEVRDAIESLSQSRHAVVVEIEELLKCRGCSQRHRFPHNWCDFASCALAGHIARELGIGHQVFIVKWTAEAHLRQHWWVRIGDVDVDITCDQFDFAPNKIIVESKSTWHTEHFAQPTCIEFCARGLCNEKFELALKALELAVHTATVKQRALRSFRSRDREPPAPQGAKPYGSCVS